MAYEYASIKMPIVDREYYTRVPIIATDLGQLPSRIAITNFISPQVSNNNFRIKKKNGRTLRNSALTWDDDYLEFAHSVASVKYYINYMTGIIDNKSQFSKDYLDYFSQEPQINKLKEIIKDVCDIWESKGDGFISLLLENGSAILLHSQYTNNPSVRDRIRIDSMFLPVNSIVWSSGNYELRDEGNWIDGGILNSYMRYDFASNGRVFSTYSDFSETVMSTFFENCLRDEVHFEFFCSPEHLTFKNDEYRNSTFSFGLISDSIPCYYRSGNSIKLGVGGVWYNLIYEFRTTGFFPSVNNNMYFKEYVPPTKWFENPWFVQDDNASVTSFFVSDKYNREVQPVGSNIICNMFPFIYDDIEGYVYDDSPNGTGGDISGTEGGGGNFDKDSDEIDIPDTPTTSASFYGITRLYIPTVVQLNNFLDYIFSNGDFLSTIENSIKKLFENPLDFVLSLHALPFEITSEEVDTNVTFCRINTDLSINYTNHQYKQISGGYFDLKEYYGSFLDYNTEVIMYIPFVGNVNLDVKKIMTTRLHLVYNVDIMTGNAIAFVSSVFDEKEHVLYSFNCNMKMDLPLTAVTYSNIITSLLGVANLNMGFSKSNSKFNNGKKTIQSKGTSETRSGSMSLANVVGSAVDAFVPSIETVNNSTGNVEWLNNFHSYLIIKRPRQSLPASFNRLDGYPSNITYKLKDLSGFTIVSRCHVDKLKCTSTEKDMILDLLYNGVQL